MADKIIIDKRINSLVYRCADKKVRSLFIIHGSEAVAQVMPIYLQISSTTEDIISILWCHKSYSKDVSKLRKSMLKNKDLLKAGKMELKNDFDGFMASSQIKFCSYDETQNILGNTYNLCVIQDFNAVTPNILCRVVETISGGGGVIILFPNCSKIQDIASLPLDMHNRLMTYNYPDVNSSYMKRFLKSISWCKTCLVLNDKLEVNREFSVNKKSLKALPTQTDDGEELQNCIANLDSTMDPLPRLIKLCKTIDQAKAVIKMVQMIKDKSSKETISLTASRGRGKSAALGLATAAAIYLKVVNIFAVAPSPGNLKTYFEFVLRGFDVLDYIEDTHYCIYQSLNPSFNKAIISIRVFKENFQYVQYLDPVDNKKLAHANLVVIDEAAAIPLTQVKAMVGPYNVLMASTINGYEGTGRSYSLKLLNDFRRQSVHMDANSTSNNFSYSDANSVNRRLFHELTLEKSIRYASNDPLESWLYDLLCLNATSLSYPSTHLPAPSDCELYYVNKNFLFSGCKDSEKFLNQILSLLVASHYKNKPDDLLLLSDSTSHHLFVLLSTITTNESAPLPTVFSVLQICCEGGIPAEEAKKYDYCNLPNGDLIPWGLINNFRALKDFTFTERKCIRIVRLATNPNYQSMGYGSKAVKLLIDYYKKDFVPLESIKHGTDSSEENTLLTSLTEREPEPIDYVGVSYGITPQLYKFWNRLKFSLVYISQSENETTGECNCVMLYPIDLSTTNTDESDEKCLPWYMKLYRCFGEDFKALVKREPLRDMDLSLATEIMHSIRRVIPERRLCWEELEKKIDSKDILRLGLYSKRQADRFLILYTFGDLAALYFSNRLHSKFALLELSFKQSALLVSFGYQGRHLIEEVAESLDCTVESALALLNRTVTIIYKALSEVQKDSIRKDIISSQASGMNFMPISMGGQLDEDMEEYDPEAIQQSELANDESLSTISVKRKIATMSDEAFMQAVAEPKKAKKNKRKKH